MYQTILLPLDTSPTDRTIVDHVKQLAQILGSRVVLLHVSTSVSGQFRGDDAGGLQVDECRSYLEKVKEEFEAAKVHAEVVLAFGDPVTQIVHYAQGSKCDLVAMGTHGHRLVKDLLLGVTASRVQHHLSVPVLLLRSK